MAKKLAVAAGGILIGIILAAVLAVLILSLAGLISPPFRLSEAGYFFLIMFFGMLEFGVLYILYSMFVAFERDRYDQ